MGTRYSVNESTGVITTAGGISLPTSGGTATDLDYYEEGTHTTTWGGAMSPAVSGDVVFTRNGNIVTLLFPLTTDDTPANATMTMTTVLPARLRPTALLRFSIIRINSGSDGFGRMDIATDGNITIGKNASLAAFDTGAEAGIFPTCISYCI
ncbi:MAG: hypothetical protein GWN62_02155 [Aliifodinibius sp.]|nr:hypothetical protein [Fodinibius sp.]